MLSSQKLVPFDFPAALIVLILLPLDGSADEHTRTHNTHSSNKFKVHKVTPQLSYEIKLHGFLLWASVGFLMPISILIKRMSNREASRRKLRIIFHIHAITQVLAVLLAAAGGIMSIKYFDNSFNNDHQIIGLVFYGLIWLQTLVSIFRPQRGSKVRGIWFLFHWLVGIAASLFGIINIFTGLQAYHKRTLEEVRIWTVIFMVEISFILFFYLLQEKWHYIQKQGTMVGDETDQETHRSSLQKRTSPETF